MPNHLKGYPVFDEEEEEIKDLELESEQEDSNDEGDDWDDGEGFDLDDDSEETESDEEDDSAATDEDSDEDTSEDEDDDQNEESDEQSDDESVEEVEESQDSKEEDTTSEQEEGEQAKKGEPDPELAREAFKRREAERKYREAQEKQEAENLQRYLEEAKEDEAEFNKRANEVQTYVLNKERSAVLQDKLDVGINKAVVELGIDKADEATKQFLARRLDEFEQGRIVKDQHGNIREVRGDVYQYIKDEMDSISQFRSVGAREQAKKKQTEKARTVKTPSRTPKEPKKDAELDAFDEEASRW